MLKTNCTDVGRKFPEKCIAFILRRFGSGCSERKVRDEFSLETCILCLGTENKMHYFVYHRIHFFILVQ